MTTLVSLWTVHGSYNASMHRTVLFASLTVFVLACFWGLASFAQNALPSASPEDRALAREIFKQLIEINTTDTPKGSVTAGSAAMQKRFLDAGFPAEDVHLLGPDPRKQNLVVRLRAGGPTTEKPVLFLCHMDVVEALRSDWHTDPFEFVEKDGYYYGRGTQDMKNSDAAQVFTFLRLHREGYKPKRGRRQVQRGRLAGAAASRPRGCCVRHQSRRGRRGIGPRARRGSRRGGDGKGLFRFSDYGGESRRAQFPAPAGQRNL
jgi:hypothetical protein